MTFSYPRTVRFHETDSAGVVYFANVLTLCHEAYEASLSAAGLEVETFFSPVGTVVPVVHSSIDFFKPLRCGDRLRIDLQPALLSTSEFQIVYKVFPELAQKASVQALTRHVCIAASSRKRVELPTELLQWLERFCG